MRKRKTQGEKAVVEPTHVESKRPDRSLQSLLTLACRIGFATINVEEGSATEETEENETDEEIIIM